MLHDEHSQGQKISLVCLVCVFLDVVLIIQIKSFFKCFNEAKFFNSHIYSTQQIFGNLSGFF